MTTKPAFQFQEFAVWDDRCGMKVGTDGVLLGAWAPIGNAKKILDAGTGCGIIALMLAQRTEAFGSEIFAIEIDGSASAQAAENFAGSPWSHRLPTDSESVHGSLQQLVDATDPHHRAFDLIVCNPPFFDSSFPAGTMTRSQARHDQSLSRDALFESARMLLAESGRICVVLPHDQANSSIEIASQSQLNLSRRVNVLPNPGSDPKRVLLEFTPQVPTTRVEPTEFVIEVSRHQYSEEFGQLLGDFYLRYSNPSGN